MLIPILIRTVKSKAWAYAAVLLLSAGSATALYVWVSEVPTPKAVGSISDQLLVDRSRSRADDLQACTKPPGDGGATRKTSERCLRDWYENASAFDPDRFHMTDMWSLLTNGALGVYFVALGLGAIASGWFVQRSGQMSLWVRSRTLLGASALGAAMSAIVLLVLLATIWLAGSLAAVAISRGTFQGLDGPWFVGVAGTVARMSLVGASLAAVGWSLSVMSRSAQSGLGVAAGYFVFAGIAPKAEPLHLFAVFQSATLTAVADGRIPSTGGAMVRLLGLAGALAVASIVAFVKRDL